jgi:hypothetical protein
VTGARPLNCFISFNAAATREAARVTEILEDLGVDTYRADVLAGREIGPEILAAINAADFLCLIVSDSSPSPNVAFETGLAIGLGKPILALATRASIPFDFAKGVQMVRIAGGDVASVRREIERFVRHMRPGPREPHEGGRALQSVGWAEAELDRIKQTLAAPEREDRLVDLVARLFEQQGSEVLRERQEGDHARLDLLVWNDILVSELGGPLIVECKYYGGGSGSVLVNAGHAFEQLVTYVDQSTAKLGLLIFDHDRPTGLSLTQYETPKVLAFFVRDFVAAIGADNLPDEIRRRRARAARPQGYRGGAD